MNYSRCLSGPPIRPREYSLARKTVAYRRARQNALGIATATLLLLWHQPGSAQPSAEAVAARDAAFGEMMARPADPDATMRYARASSAVGDSPAAINALERLLRLNPSLDNVRLELASLHLANGSPELASLYARQALANPTIPQDVAQRARVLLAQAERGAARSVLEVNLYAGARHDSNANEATSLGSVPIFAPGFGGFVDVQNPNTGESDWSMVLGGSVAHRYDLGLQREGSWETNAGFFDQRFATIPRQYDLSIFSIDTGPRIGIADVGSDGTLALRPFFSAGWVGYGGDTYTWLYGGGLTTELRLPPDWTVELTWLGRFGNYQNSQYRPTARDYTGFENSVLAALRYSPTPAMRFSAIAAWYDASARQGYLERESLGGRLVAEMSLPLTATYTIGAAARAGVRRVQYDEPDPFLDPTRSRRDTRWEAGASVILPVTGPVSVVVEYDYYDQRSNYSIYRYDNHSISVAVRLSL